MRELNRHRHELGRLVGRVAEHHPLVARAAGVDALRDVGRLAIDRAQHRARLAVEAEARVVVADRRDRAAHDVRDRDVGIRRDLAGDARESGGHERFACDARIGISRENRVEHGIGDLVRDLVGMTFGHRLGGEIRSCSLGATRVRARISRGDECEAVGPKRSNCILPQFTSRGASRRAARRPRRTSP